MIIFKLIGDHMNEKANLILHPVRLQIIKALVGDKKLTVQEIGQYLSDVPQATLYRHLNKLVQGGIIESVAQNQVRGTVEKVYALASNGGITPQEFMESSSEEKLGVFIQFVSGLINDFGNYVEQKNIDPIKDGLSFRQVDLHLNDQEFMEFAKGLGAVFQKYIQNTPGKGRKKRTIATIMIPDAGKGAD
jgi:DNA-binding transcriptional ArsR family regulator